MRQIEWNVVNRLGDRYDILAERMCYSCFIHHIRVLAGEVNHDDLRSEDQIKDVLNNRALFPNVVGSQATKPRCPASSPNCFINGGKFGFLWHHYRLRDPVQATRLAR